MRTKEKIILRHEKNLLSNHHRFEYYPLLQYNMMYTILLIHYFDKYFTCDKCIFYFTL